MSIDSEELAILSAPYRRELLVHCYRMLGDDHRPRSICSRHSQVTSAAVSFPGRRDQYL
jgi:hypothetical protein